MRFPVNSKETENTGRRVKAVDHVIDVLEALNANNGACGVSYIARQTGLAKATVHHLLKTLETRGYVAKDLDTSHYRLSWRLYELGSAVVRDLRLEQISDPYLGVLASQTGETVLLSILEDDSLLYIDSADAPHSLRLEARAGTRAPLHATASGKIHLAYNDDKDLFTRIIKKGLPRWTPTTIIDTDLLRKDIANTRKQGYALCWEEREVGLSSVAVPLRDYTGKTVAVLAIAGSISRLNRKTYKQHLQALQEIRRLIETELGADKAAIGEDSFS